MCFRNLTQDGAQAQTELESLDAYWMLVPSGWKVKKHKRNANAIREDTSPKYIYSNVIFCPTSFYGGNSQKCTVTYPK